jgi:tRNA pseudouridine55 synthase
MDGFLNIYKEKGMTSHDVVNRLRRILGIKKIGHAGTLDPNAQGVLLLGVGRATRFMQYLILCDKVYLAQVVFGIATDTCDITGQVTARGEADFSPRQFTAALDGFKGGYLQVPPLYSAIKKDGRKLYQYAREGQQVDVPPRPVTIHAIDVVEDAGLPKEAVIRVACSKGTYIRALCRDIGEALDTPATMGDLVREGIGDFDLKQAHTLDEIEALKGGGRLEEAFIPVGEALGHYRRVSVSQRGAPLVRNGNALYPWNSPDDFGSFHKDELLRLIDEQGFIGLGRFDDEEDGPAVRPVRII